MLSIKGARLQKQGQRKKLHVESVSNVEGARLEKQGQGRRKKLHVESVLNVEGATLEKHESLKETNSFETIFSDQTVTFY